MTQQRVCLAGGCKTYLSRHNPGPRCYEHTPTKDLVRAERMGPRSLRAVSDRFRFGYPGVYALSAKDAESYRSGTWLGDMKEKA